jgi:Na+-translocating ferredoxin:NAD+ oxidoreductase RnfG subunit
MKDRHLYTIIAAVFLLLGATNLVTIYLYAKEKILHHKTEKNARQLTEKMQSEYSESSANLEEFRKQAQRKFLESLSVLNIAKDKQTQIRQQLISAMTQRGKHVQLLHANRAANINDALKIIQEDGTIFGLYNQYLQIADGREKTFIEKSKPLGASLGIGTQEKQR